VENDQTSVLEGVKAERRFGQGAIVRGVQMSKRKYLWGPVWLLFWCASAPWPEAFAGASGTCDKSTTNWPPSGTWCPSKGQGNEGQSAYSGFTQIWTHVYNGGEALDEIMFQLSGSQAVSIYDSPAVPDRGGHSILGGMLRGNFAAILPNLAVCVSTPGYQNVCTRICKPGHSCLGQPLAAQWPAGSRGGPSTISVYDIDEPDHPNSKNTHLIAKSRQDPSQCTAARHCKWPVADQAAYGKDSTVEIAFIPPCDPEQAHVVQFVSTLACVGSDCPAAPSVQRQLDGYDSTGCGGRRRFEKWYLDNGSCTSPFLTPEVFCNGANCSAPCGLGKACKNTVHGLRTVIDEPSVVIPVGDTSYQLQKRFVDFMMCGADIKDVIQWTRTGIGAKLHQSPSAKPRVFASNYQIVASTDVQKIKNQICNVETPEAAKSAMANPTYQAIRKYLGCRS
jgi:hypothetical protein